MPSLIQPKREKEGKKIIKEGDFEGQFLRERCESWYSSAFSWYSSSGSCHKRQKPQAPTPQAPIRNHQLRKVANAKGLNRNY